MESLVGDLTFSCFTLVRTHTKRTKQNAGVKALIYKTQREANLAVKEQEQRGGLWAKLYLKEGWDNEGDIIFPLVLSAWFCKNYLPWLDMSLSLSLKHCVIHIQSQQT